MILETIGRLHPLLVHLPIGIILLALAMEVYRPRTIETEAGMAAARRIAWLIGALTAVLSCVTGLLLESEGDHAQQLTDRHKWSALATTLLACLGYAATTSRTINGIGLLFRRTVRTSVLAGLLLTGHFGGTLTHGEGYLSSAIFNRGFDDVGRSAPDIPPVTDGSLVYADIVSPILQNRCVECHGPTKQKGGLRLDGMDALLKGGGDGPVLVKGDPEASELYRRLRLPLNDEHHMPPPKKPQPTEEEMRLLHWWIRKGHDFKGTVSESTPDSGMRSVFSVLSSKGEKKKAETKVASEWPSGDIQEADPRLLSGLRKSGILVLPAEPGKPYLQASLINTTLSADSAVRMLLGISKQLVWLKADVKGLSDEGCSHLSKLTDLTRLSLAGSSVTDMGLARLSTLANLRRLNLSGTAVTEKGVGMLGLKPSLEQLYLYDTKVDRSSLPAMRELFPAARIDTGGYRLDAMPSDTGSKRF